jgi:hypothetical protein
MSSLFGLPQLTGRTGHHRLARDDRLRGRHAPARRRRLRAARGARARQRRGHARDRRRRLHRADARGPLDRRRALPTRRGRRRSTVRRSRPARRRCSRREQPHWAPSEPASSTPRATSGHSGPANPAAVGEAPSGRPLGPEATMRSRGRRCRESLRNPDTQTRPARPYCCSGAGKQASLSTYSTRSEWTAMKKGPRW